MKEKRKNEKSYLLGTIGAIIGVVVSLILLIVLYIYIGENIILSIAIIIPFIEFYFYKWFNGKMDENTSKILLVINISLILIITLIALPITLLVKSNLEISIEAINNMYLTDRLYLRMIEDTLNILIYSIVGLYFMNLILKRKLLINVEEMDLFSSNIKEKQEYKQKAIKEVKKYFEKYGAMSVEKSISKDKFNIKLNKTFEKYFNYLKEMNIIRKYNGKYYYSEKDENNIKSYGLIKKTLIVSTIALIIILSNVLGFEFLIVRKFKKVENNELKFKISTDWNEIKKKTSEKEWIYSQYLDIEETSQNNIPETINISYEKEKDSNYKSINELKEILENYIIGYLKYENYAIDVYNTSKDNQVLEIIFNNEKTKELNYYIFKDGKIACISATTNSEKEETLKNLQQEVKEIIESFEWKN